MQTLRAAWRRIGSAPALPVTVAFFALAVVAGLALDEAIVGGVLFAALVTYCVARESNGSDLFWIISAPSALSMLAHDAFGTPRRLAAVLLPSVFWAAWRIDRNGATSETADGAAGSATTDGA